ncbi:MAG: hypothetical protein WC889_05665 [Myxococcota bacterium]|jgi:hypothetical protein
MKSRFELIQEPVCLWTVWDREVERPADPEGKPAMGLSLEDAVDMLSILHAQEMRQMMSRHMSFPEVVES